MVDTTTEKVRKVIDKLRPNLQADGGDIEMTRNCAYLEPDYIAIEPPELIGGEQSVVDADPELVVEAVDKIL